MNNKLLLSFMLLLTCFGMAKANTYYYEFPLASHYNYSLSLQVYPEDLFDSGIVNSISFYVNPGDAQARTIEIYMLTSESNSLGDVSDITEDNKVFSGTVNFASSSWTQIMLDKTYTHDKSTNLCIIVNDKTGHSSSDISKSDLSFKKDTRYDDSQTHAIVAFGNEGSFDAATFQGPDDKIIITPGDGQLNTIQLGYTNPSPTLPLATNYNYSFSAQMIGRGGATIPQFGLVNGISFYALDGEAQSRDLDIYIAKRTNTFNIANVTEDNKVFSGTVNFAIGTKTPIIFDKPFEYTTSMPYFLVINDKTGSHVSEEPITWALQNHVIPGTGDKAFTYANNENGFTLDNYESLKESSVHTRYNYTNIIDFYFLNEIGSGNAVSSSLPTNVYYNNSLSQQIYTKEEIGEAQDLTSISFYNTGNARTRNLDIYLVPTDKVNFSSSTDWINFTEADKIFSGEITFERDKWTAIGFNRIFKYDGLSNLAIIIDDNTGSYESAVSFKTFEAGDKQPTPALYIHSDGTNYDASGLSGYGGSVSSAKNQIRLNEEGLDIRPANLVVSGVTHHEAHIEWSGIGNMWDLRYKPDDTYSDTWTEVNGVTSKSYDLTGLTEGTYYKVCVRINYGSGNYGNWIAANFTTEAYPVPSDLELLSVTPYSAVLKWKENGTATAWQVWTSDDVIHDAKNQTTIVTGLTPGTEYNAAVRAVIDADNEIYSHWYSSCTFTTPLPNPAPEVTISTEPTTATFKIEGQSESYKIRYKKNTSTFFESFEMWPVDWGTTRNDEGIEETDWQPSRNFAHTGYYSAKSASWVNNQGAYHVDNWLYTPKIDLGGTLKFWIKCGDPNYPENYEVLISTTNVNNFTTLREMTACASNEWTEIAIDLSAYEGQQGYIAIRHKDYDKFNFYVDDFGLYNGEDEWKEIVTTEKEVTIEGLEPDTPYDYEVIGLMQGQPDAYTALSTFTTLGANPAPYNINIVPGAAYADVKWEGNGDNYTIGYKRIISESEGWTFFEDFESGWYGKGWTQYSQGETVPGSSGWYLTNANSSVVACANSYYYDGSGHALDADNWLITPQVSLGGKLCFTEGIRPDYPDVYEVLLSTTGTAVSNFTEVLRPLSIGEGASQGGSTITWTNVEIDLSNYEGQQGYIAIHHKCKDKFMLYIDDVGIYRAIREYGTPYFCETTSTECRVENGLSPNNRYELEIRSDKAGYDYAVSIPVTFTTTSQDPIDLVLDDLGDNRSILKNNTVANVTIQNRTFEDGIWQGIYLPFDLTLKGSLLERVDIRTVESTTKEGNQLMINCLTPVTQIEAGKPYIMKWNKGYDLSDPVFNGVTIKNVGTSNFASTEDAQIHNFVYYAWNATDSSGKLYIMPNAKGTILSPVGTSYRMRAFEPYFIINNPEAYDLIYLNTGDPKDQSTGISSLKGNEEEIIYNLAGQRLAKKQRGINIVKQGSAKARVLLK